MTKETVQVAQYAATFRYEDVPPDVVDRAKQCITDTIATVIFGYDLPWSRIVVAFAEKKADLDWIGVRSNRGATEAIRKQS